MTTEQTPKEKLVTPKTRKKNLLILLGLVLWVAMIYAVSLIKMGA